MSAHLQSLRTEARRLPESPGVYFWCDAADEILYIGKALNLRARVSSYFSTALHDRRTRDLLLQARSIQFELTTSELEALFRESALIKQEQPPFNRALRTTRLPFYLKFDGARMDPYMEVSRSADDPDSLYFGPFRTGRATRETMAYLHDVLPLRKCKAANPKCKPCLYYQMHTCAAPALDDEHRNRHQDAIDQLFDLLDGRTDKVMNWLISKRDRLCDSLLFERAAEIQERIDILNSVQRQHAILEAAIQCRCVVIRQTNVSSGSERLLLVAHGHVLSVRDGRESDSTVILRWVRAHGAVIAVMKNQQSEIDSASVLERWIASNRSSVAWVAIPQTSTDDDLLERIQYVVDGNPSTSSMPNMREKIPRARRGNQKKVTSTRKSVAVVQKPR